MYTGPMRGGSAGTSVRGQESQEGARESLKGPNSIGHIIFNFFNFFFVISTQILNFERSLICHRGPKAVLFGLGKFFLEALYVCKAGQDGYY